MNKKERERTLILVSILLTVLRNSMPLSASLAVENVIHVVRFICFDQCHFFGLRARIDLICFSLNQAP